MIGAAVDVPFSHARHSAEQPAISRAPARMRGWVISMQSSCNHHALSMQSVNECHPGIRAAWFGSETPRAPQRSPRPPPRRVPQGFSGSYLRFHMRILIKIYKADRGGCKTRCKTGSRRIEADRTGWCARPRPRSLPQTRRARTTRTLRSSLSGKS